MFVGEDLGHSDEGRPVDALKQDGIDIDDQDTGCESGIAVSAKILPRQDPFEERTEYK